MPDPTPATTRTQRQKYMAWVEYPPARDGAPPRLRTLICFTCNRTASRGCVKHHHLVGEQPKMLPALSFVTKETP